MPWRRRSLASVAHSTSRGAVPLTATDTRTEDCVSSGASSSSVLVPSSTFCLWVALHVTGRPLSKARWSPFLTSPQRCYGGSAIQALIIPAGQELPLPQSLEHGVWLRAEKDRIFRPRSHIYPCLCQISFSSFRSKLKDNKQGEVILLQLTITG